MKKFTLLSLFIMPVILLIAIIKPVDQFKPAHYTSFPTY